MELPARIGKYELQELLGGGMSRVYRARDTVIGRPVVVKILTEQASKDPDAKARKKPSIDPETLQKFMTGRPPKS